MGRLLTLFCSAVLLVFFFGVQKTAAYGHFGRDDKDFTWEVCRQHAQMELSACMVALSLLALLTRLFLSPCVHFLSLYRPSRSSSSKCFELLLPLPKQQHTPSQLRHATTPFLVEGSRVALRLTNAPCTIQQWHRAPMSFPKADAQSSTPSLAGGGEAG